MSAEKEKSGRRGRPTLSSGSRPIGGRCVYSVGIVALLSACHASPSRSADSASAEEMTAEVRKLKQDYAALELRLQDVEAERDRLRERAEAAEPSAEQLARDADADHRVSALEEKTSPGGLPVVKLLPVAPSAAEPGAEPSGAEPRPVLRVHGEEPGTVTSGDIDDEPAPAKKHTSRRGGAPSATGNASSMRPAGAAGPAPTESMTRPAAPPRPLP